MKIIALVLLSSMLFVSCGSSEYSEPQPEQVLSLPKADCGGDACF